jgi:hypothetical protein
LIHATLLPWHAATRASLQSDAVALAADLATICHSANLTQTARAPTQQSPSDSDTICPICKGLVGLQLAVLPASEPFVSAPPANRSFLVPVAERAAEAILPQPRSRGPPTAV